MSYHPYTFETEINRGDGWETFQTIFLASPDQQDKDVLIDVARDWLIRLHQTLADTTTVVEFYVHVRETDHFTYDDDTDTTHNSPYRFIGKATI